MASCHAELFPFPPWRRSTLTPAAKLDAPQGRNVVRLASLCLPQQREKREMGEMSRRTKLFWIESREVIHPVLMVEGENILFCSLGK
uniref:Uncharacterized protein n=1 Tax=Oryza glumipatula TaxID=40148 RepID=A0A0D9YR42_9ORYZ